MSQQSITLTDNTRQKFFRKHYSANRISFCGLNPDKRLCGIRAPEGEIPVNNKRSSLSLLGGHPPQRTTSATSSATSRTTSQPQQLLCSQTKRYRQRKSSINTSRTFLASCTI